MASNNLTRYEFLSIRLVVLCVEEGTLSGAARKANLSVSGASHRLKQFENTLGTQLFRRHRLGLAATERGKAVAEHGSNLLAVLDQLKRAATVAAGAPEPS